MFPYALTFVTLCTTVSASIFHAHSPIHVFGGVKKRQGYIPNNHLCGEGNTCGEACGGAYVQCPSTDGIYCYNPSSGERCCANGGGNSCDAGYYCTSESTGNTYCCPNGTDVTNCAASDSLTVSLVLVSTLPSPTSHLSGHLSYTAPFSPTKSIAKASKTASGTSPMEASSHSSVSNAPLLATTATEIEASLASRKPSNKEGISSDVIAGIVVGALTAIGLFDLVTIAHPQELWHGQKSYSSDVHDLPSAH
ncbi:hypothetical protein BCR34DRAFT_662305 [Clohesyomyces aquaticus]|uniref:Uncharacterized protein n=1 Tax=Clohesyomyces aquaticus TaxID=1231657 RepID=A0A1Y1ZY92_9PLEO|nr:hypothetical protein BCR34DRAFT_662305 [Clohesyomyces aquaticus]